MAALQALVRMLRAEGVTELRAGDLYLILGAAPVATAPAEAQAKASEPATPGEALRAKLFEGMPGFGS